MTFTLFAATVPSFLQTLGAVRGLIDKADAFCSRNGLAPEELIEARLVADMRPFSFQVTSTLAHSLGAVRSLEAGLFTPDTSAPPATFDAMRDRLGHTIAALEDVTPDRIDGFEGRDMTFRDGDFEMHFTAENFLLSFSMPNFYFHATTAYDILRMKGVPIGKRDFSGKRRTKADA